MSIDELLQVQTWFFDRLRQLQQKEWHMTFLSFLKYRFQDARRVYLFEKNKPYMRLYHLDDWLVRFVDETEKIDIMLDKAWLDRVHNLIKNKSAMKTISSNESLLDQLLVEFQQWKFSTIWWKPYLVFDIETTIQQSTPTYFEMSYDIVSWADHSLQLEYSYVDRDSMRDLADRLLAFDWWIIWYNNIWFDNPVLLRNCWYDAEKISLLQQKSLDPFLVFYKLTGRRMSLANVAAALIGAWKTLASWMEWSELIKQYKATWNKKLLEKVKLYCKNDVEITLGVVLYLLAYKNVHFDGSLYTVDEETFMSLGSREWQDVDEESAQSLF